MLAPIKTLSVIIVNYNSGEYAKDCIESVFLQQGLTVEVIVVDNKSPDNSAKVLKDSFGARIKLIESAQNLGFGCANNLAATQASGEYLLLLNPDTTIQALDALVKLIKFAEENVQFGMIGPAIFEPRKHKNVLPRYHYPASRKLKFTQHLSHLPGEIAWLLGACMLLKRSVYQEIKGFDPDYFLYGEDADICLRLRQAGYPIGYCPSVQINHVSGASEAGADSLEKWLRKKRGINLFYKKNYDKRDCISLAKSVIFKSNLYLLVMQLKLAFTQNKLQLQDDINRIKASKIAAAELIKALR